MAIDTVRTLDRTGTWPLTQEALTRLVDEVARLREDLTTMTGQGIEEGAFRLDVAVAERRLRTLHSVLDRCHVTDDQHVVAIGRRATLEDRDSGTASYEIVAPGDGEPNDGCISADSPLGQAILGARAGDVVDVHAPAGAWSVVVVAVE